jgi:hypothetical protein
MSPLKKQNSFEEKLKEQMDSMDLKPSDALWSRIERNIQADSFEPKLQQKLSDYAVEPHQEVWEQVASQLPENKRRKGFLWFASVCTILLATFGAGYWMSLQTNAPEQLVQAEKIAPSSQTTSDAQVAVPYESAKNGNRVVPSEKPEVTNKPLVQPENKPVTIQSASKEGNRAAPRRNIASTTSPNRANRGSARNNQLPPSGIVPPNTNELPGASSSNNASGAIVQIPSTTSQPSVQPSSDAQNHLVQSGQSEVIKPSDSKTTSEIGSNSESKSNAEPKVILESGSILPPAPKDSFTETPVFRGNSYVAPEENFTHFSISAMAGANLTFMQLSMPKSSSYAGLQHAYDLRKELEKPALDFSGGLNLNYHFGKSWFVFTGIGISSFKQSVSFSVIPANQSNPPRIQPVNLYMNANDSIISGTGNNYENKYSFTEIPLWLGYQFPSDGKMHVEVMGGLSYGRLNLVSAYMPDPGCIGMLVVTDKASFPTFKNVFFFGIAPALSFQINSSVDVGGMISAKVALNSMVDNSNWIQQKPASTGLNLFLRKRF